MNSWIASARRLAEDVLAPHADEVDRTGTIPAGHFDALADGGFYGLTLSDEIDPAAFTEVGETMVAGCLATSFVWAQHLGVARRIAGSSNHGLRDRFTDDLRAGRVRAGVSYAGADDRADLRARRVEGGYVLDGTAPFVTGWGLVDILGVMARDTEDPDMLVSVVLAAKPGDQLEATAIPLAAADASRTVTLRADGLFVPDTDVDGLVPMERFRAASVLAIWRNGTLALGLVRRCLAELERLGLDASALGADAALARTELDAALGGRGDMADARAHASALALRAAGALTTGIGSAAARRGGLADRTLREAAFTLVFGSRPAIRTALLTRLSAPSN